MSGMDGIDLGPPIATLRSLKVLATHGDIHDPNTPTPKRKRLSSFDPVRQGLLTVNDAQKAIDIFFDHCHPSAPVLDESTRYSWGEPELHAPALILAICSIGARFWFKANLNNGSSAGGVHRSFNELTRLLDKAVSRLLLRPTPSDVTLDSIRVLLLYAQWMPCIREEDDDVDDDGSTSRFPRSRYNEISAGAVLGLAMRYAHFVGLNRTSMAPFERNGKSFSGEDVSKLRVYYNLLTCNFNLMLTSGFPASIDFDPELSANVAQAFSSHKESQYPGDIRIGLPRLLKLNEELFEWERAWHIRLKSTGSRHNHMPFNSVRWYRLSLNSASLTPLLVETKFPDKPLLASLHQTLNISLTSAAQMILSLSIFGEEFVWGLNSQDRLTFPNDGPYHADPDSIDRLFCAVDSTWISHTFAVTFLALCYIRGIVDENLQIRAFTNDPIIPSRLPKSSTSILANLLHLAMEIFDGVCSIATFHTARDFQGVVHYASSLVLDPEDEEKGNGQDVNDYAFQSLLEMMNNSGVDWAGNLLGSLDENLDWNIGNF
ncbi:hypothetical protein N7451_011807 [Penicillium sp. IBT 35674x]|nr:hypothetical protein N7451_011807 [Penicillium sp. IBT 35674x]